MILNNYIDCRLGLPRSTYYDLLYDIDINSVGVVNHVVSNDQPVIHNNCFEMDNNNNDILIEDNDKTNNVSLEELKDKLFNKYRYKKFNMTFIYRDIFRSNTNSVSSLECKLKLNQLVQANYISKIKSERVYVFRINLLSAGGRYLEFNHILKSLERFLNKCLKNEETASLLRRRLKLN